MKRRKFIESLAILTAATKSVSAAAANTTTENDYWKKIANEYTRVRNQKILNLNTASACVLPDKIADALLKFNEQILYNPPSELLKGNESIKLNAIGGLSKLIQSKSNEISLTRNCTEALNILLQGVKQSNTSKFLYSSFEYPYIDFTLEGMKSKNGTSALKINISEQASDRKIINRYRVLLENNNYDYLVLTHVTYKTGRILPIKEITAIAHKYGTQVILDGAHSLGHISYSIKNLNVDYAAFSLHKWLNAPLGNGLLFIKENLISTVTPLMPNSNIFDDKILKFEYLGTQPYQQMLGVGAAISFLNEIGLEKKEARLKQLKKYFKEKVEEKINRKLNNIIFYLEAKDVKYSSICTYSIKNVNESKIVKSLLKNHNIHTKKTNCNWETQKSDSPNLSSNSLTTIRFSPNLFLLEEDIDRFVDALYLELKNQLDK